MKKDDKKCDCNCEGTCECGNSCGCDESAEIITMVDGDGAEHFFTNLFEFEFKGIVYAVLQELLASEAEAEEDETEMFIAAKVQNGDQAEYGFISDENVFNEVIAELNRILEQEDNDNSDN